MPRATALPRMTRGQSRRLVSEPWGTIRPQPPASRNSGPRHVPSAWLHRSPVTPAAIPLGILGPCARLVHSNESYRMTTNTINDNAIAPEDMDLARELASFDPVHDVPSPVQVTGTVRLPTELRLTMLSPNVQAQIRAELENVPAHRRDQAEKELVGKHLYQNSYALRARAGLGDDATPIQREAFAIAREMGDLQDEDLRIAHELGEVERWETKFDPATGKDVPVPAERVQGERRQKLEARRREIEHHLKLLEGPEGEHRKAKALKESVEQVKAKRQQLEDHAEIDRRARDKAREDRIEKAAEARAKRYKDTL